MFKPDFLSQIFLRILVTLRSNEEARRWLWPPVPLESPREGLFFLLASCDVRVWVCVRPGSSPQPGRFNVFFLAIGESRGLAIQGVWWRGEGVYIPSSGGRQFVRIPSPPGGGGGWFGSLPHHSAAPRDHQPDVGGRAAAAGTHPPPPRPLVLFPGSFFLRNLSSFFSMALSPLFCIFGWPFFGNPWLGWCRPPFHPFLCPKGDVKRSPVCFLQVGLAVLFLWRAQDRVPVIRRKSIMIPTNIDVSITIVSIAI